MYFNIIKNRTSIYLTICTIHISREEIYQYEITKKNIQIQETIIFH